jgi:hypothetical protein
MLKQWGLKWSYSTAFYLGESAFSTLLSKRIEEGTNLQSTHGGKFQITSTDKGVGKLINQSIDHFDYHFLFLLRL